MRRLSRGRHIDPRSPRGYYVDHSDQADPRGPVDEAGLPVLPAPFDGVSHSPLAVARYALGNLELYLEGGSGERRDRFERAAAHLSESVETVPASFGGWAMPPASGPYSSLLPSGRFAAGAQGECLSTVVRAWSLLGMDAAERAARASFCAFRAPVEDGGLMREVGDPVGETCDDTPVFLEEYPISGRAVMSLSGHMRGLLGVYDYWKASGDDEARSVWSRSLEALEFLVDEYDLGYWTLDNLDWAGVGARVSSLASLREHVLHMQVLSELAENEALAETARRWSGYLRPPLHGLRALRGRLDRSAQRRRHPGQGWRP